jgi:hypothetical protein
MRSFCATGYLSIFLVIASCGGGNKETLENTNEILITLYDTLAQPALPKFPPLPEGCTIEDSLQITNKIIALKEEQSKKNITVAIPAYLSSGKNLEVDYLTIDDEFKNLIIQLKSLEAKPLDLSLLKNHRKDSVIEYDEHLLDPQVSDYLKFDLLISFSRVAFNESGNKAVVIGSRNTSGLAGHSALYFFEREKGKWKIIKSMGIWIA